MALCGRQRIDAGDCRTRPCKQQCKKLQTAIKALKIAIRKGIECLVSSGTFYRADTLPRITSRACTRHDGRYIYYADILCREAVVVSSSHAPSRASSVAARAASAFARRRSPLRLQLQRAPRAVWRCILVKSHAFLSSLEHTALATWLQASLSMPQCETRCMGRAGAIKNALFSPRSALGDAHIRAISRVEESVGL